MKISEADQRRMSEQLAKHRLAGANEVCKFYGDISKMTLFRWARDGKIPKPVKVGKLNRWRVNELLEHAENL